MARRKRAERKLVLPEDVLARLAAREEILEGEPSGGDVDAELDMDLEIASAEVAKALAQTGRPMRHLHVLRVSMELLGFRRGYVAGVRATASVCNALAEDAPRERPS